MIHVVSGAGDGLFLGVEDAAHDDPVARRGGCGLRAAGRGEITGLGGAGKAKG